MKHLRFILLTCISLTYSLVVAQTPFDSFSPETSRPMLVMEDEAAMRQQHRETLPDSMRYAVIVDVQQQAVYLADLSEERILAIAPLTEEMRNWLSVDPLSDKYPHISPYAYCGWNPIGYLDPDGKDIYVFDENGDFVTKQLKDGPHSGVVMKNGRINFAFEFADPINDPKAIDMGKITHLEFVTNEQISMLLKKSGVYDKDNRSNWFNFIRVESNAGNIKGEGKMDYVATGIYKGAHISAYQDCLFLTGVNGKKVAHNTYNFGNFLWGAGASALGVPYWMAKLGSHVNNFLNDTYSRWHWDSSDDQRSIKLGYKWQMRKK